jgi:hypothetical protein
LNWDVRFAFSALQSFLTATDRNNSLKDNDDTMRILLATDNHVGYMERDPIRGQDSINTFKEILQLAVKNDVRSNVSDK